MNKPHRLDADMLAVALTSGSVVISRDGGVLLCWQNASGGRSTLSTLYNEDAEYAIERATKDGVLIIDYRDVDFDALCRWVIRGPLMLELFEQEDADPMFPPMHPLGKMDTREWCELAMQRCGARIINLPAPKGWRKVET